MYTELRNLMYENFKEEFPLESRVATLPKLSPVEMRPWFKKGISIYRFTSLRETKAFDIGKPYIELDFIPELVTYSPKSTFSPIQAIGRNNPNYHYAGSEDTLSFKIDWYLFSRDTLSKQSVVDKCRKIEALSKANGFKSPPPIVMIKWGKGNAMFDNHLFIVTSAPYELSVFTREKGSLEGSLTPLYATQTVTLKRITPSSLTWEQILR